MNEVPICSCLPGYRGSPLTGCRHECESDSECPNHLACSSNFKCENSCKCGENAECHVINHQAKCSCPNVSIIFACVFQINFVEIAMNNNEDMNIL